MYEQSFSSHVDDDSVGAEHVVSDYLREQFPNVALALSGRSGSKKNKTPAIPPATLIIFARDGGLGFVIAPKDAPKNCHGFLADPCDVIQGIEHALANKLVGWKPAAKKRY